MTVRLHIDRLVIDPHALPAEKVPEFQAALAAELGRLRAAPMERVAAPADAAGRLARRTAQAIHTQMERR